MFRSKTTVVPLAGVACFRDRNSSSAGPLSRTAGVTISGVVSRIISSIIASSTQGGVEDRIALQVENDVFLDRAPLHRVIHTFGAVAAIGRGHDGFRVEAARGGKDALVVGRDHDAACLADAARDAPRAFQRGPSRQPGEAAFPESGTTRSARG